jgi:hypothetical protein
MNRSARMHPSGPRVAALVAGLVLAACAGAGLSAAPARAATTCPLEGVWNQTTPGVGSTKWTITSLGTATEEGIGNAEGKATLADNVLAIDWKTKNGYAGVYNWTLDPATCKSTKGTLKFTKTAAGDNRDKEPPRESSVIGPTPIEVKPESQPVTLSNVSRKVEVSRNESGWEPATNGMVLHDGDRIHTGFKSGVTLNFPEGSRAHVQAMALLVIDEVSKGPDGAFRTRLTLATGEVKSQVNRSTGARGDFQVKTPTTTASVRGTKFSVAYDGTATTVAVTESSVGVTANGGATVVVPAGSETRSTATAVAPPVAIGKGFKSGGLSSAQALGRVSGKLAGGLTRCKFGVVSNDLAPIAGGWSAKFVIVDAKQGITGKPKGTAQFQLKGKGLSARNALARKITKGCR